MNRLYQI